jgi:hypothetical protein
VETRGVCGMACEFVSWWAAVDERDALADALGADMRGSLCEVAGIVVDRRFVGLARRSTVRSRCVDIVIVRMCARQLSWAN